MLKRIVCLIGATVGGMTLSQAPEYTQQYTQRLAGAVDELTAIIDQFDADAAQFGLTRDEGLERYQASADGFLAERGISMETVFARHERLSTQLAELRTAPAGTQLFEIARYFDTDVGAAALEDFKPAVPLTVVGLGYVLVGLLVGFAVFWVLASVLGAPFRKRRSKVRLSRIERRM
ncbi:DUF2937 family protein [Pelagibacterium sp.]|uniref:DUF2937 family protein n=1 Tax=Pelagibacterium sp. TaxID=1967288 RepID=UPI003A901025